MNESDHDSNVSQFPGGRNAPNGPPGGGGGFGERLARVEAHLEHTATREDVAEVKNLIEQVKTLIERKESTMLRWLIGIIAIAAVSLMAALLRTFLSP